MSERSEADVLRLLATLGQRLHRSGATAHRLEDALTELAAALGHDAAVFSTPTLVMLRVGPETGGPTALVRVEPSGEIDLNRLCTLDRVVELAASGELDIDAAVRAARETDEESPGYPGAVTVAAGGLIGASAAVFFGGHATEAAASCALGLAVGFVDRLTAKFRGARRVRELGNAFLVALVAAWLAPEVRPALVFLATLIVYVPGLSLTTAVSELSTGNLVSGTARLTSAGLVFLQLIVGFALAGQLNPQVMSAVVTSHAIPLPDWTLVPVLVAAAFSVQVLFRARPSHFSWVFLSTVAATAGGKVGSGWFGADLGALVGATAVGLVGNIGARWRHRPAVVGILPGLLLLVPGSLGIRALSAMLDAETVVGIETAFSMGMVAVSLASGLLLANVLISPRRSL